ncbi:type III-B CRISPR module RAMP protein Cmr6 [Oxynema sp. CENA135]|nr:type III-B CRISPR module RAMP protein Cmr6 [Oxynema sp. CENA135]
MERPKQPNPPQPPKKSKPDPNQSVQRPNRPTPRNNTNNHQGGGGNRGGGNRGGGGGRDPQQSPSPWLYEDCERQADRTASFVEYLRWMRSPDPTHKDATKVQILQKAEENAQYHQRLKQLNDRTKAIAGNDNTFQVKCSWRIRVGGHRGPESILLPAFDALGMPYIPSATLRGVARTQAIREKMSESGMTWKEADKAVAPYFGHLEASNKANRSGKVVFLDAYPLPNKLGLTVDMANNIWKWENDALPSYNPNPNPFLSLKEPTFLIGLRLVTSCRNTAILDQVKKWLIAGLQKGIGSQINSGYGALMKAGAGQAECGFFTVQFSLEGQLIHGRQKFTKWSWNNRHQKWQMRGRADAEVRPIAFKSMLRYWFRTFALGVLPPAQVQDWEATLFGGINPKRWGWVRVQILNGRVTKEEPQGKQDQCGEQVGDLILSYSPEAPLNEHQTIEKLFKALTWMMFHLGGVGQGARRPCYSRTTRQHAPWYRGSTLYPEGNDNFWKLPDTVDEFKDLFQQRLQDFYQALGQFNQRQILTNHPLVVGQVNGNSWSEAIDRHCQIVVVSGSDANDKGFAVKVLHQQFHDLEHNRSVQEAKNLCGGIGRTVIASPIWIADLGDYQVVTVFGANENPRKTYLESLKHKSDEFSKIWPMP